jgi:putative transposase
MTLIEEILSDRPRAGTKKSFSVEQVVQIVAIACETPEQSERPIVVAVQLKSLSKRF